MSFFEIDIELFLNQNQFANFGGFILFLQCRRAWSHILNSCFWQLLSYWQVLNSVQLVGLQTCLHSFREHPIIFFWVYNICDHVPAKIMKLKMVDLIKSRHVLVTEVLKTSLFKTDDQFTSLLWIFVQLCIKTNLSISVIYFARAGIIAFLFWKHLDHLIVFFKFVQITFALKA